MIKPIMKDVLFLAQKSEPATAKDKNIAIDLLDTLQANADRCVGMAANMIGERKRIIVFNVGNNNSAHPGFPSDSIQDHFHIITGWDKENGWRVISSGKGQVVSYGGGYGTRQKS